MRPIALGLLAALLCGLSPAAAQDWPSRPVRIVVPFGPGSTPDIIARVVGDRMQQALGQPFVIENRPGASGNSGTDAVAKAAPDGTTVGVSIGGPLAINPLLFARMPYDPRRDIAPVSQLVTQPSVLAVHPSLPAKTAAELIALLRGEPQRYNYGSIGNGSLSHLAMEAIAQSSGAPLVHVPYQGSPAAVTALMRGDVQMAVLPAISVAPHAATGALRILAVSTGRRSPFLPGVPTLKESGVAVEADAWNGLIAPGATPAAMVGQMHRAVVIALSDPVVRERLATQMMEPVGNAPAEFRAVIDAEVARWAPVIHKSGIRIE